ncbi:MAG: glycosyltransferase family 39 protein [Lentisphaerae bacterium]|nr:glycosyltransferase family 39 protein [Lentisphaerota bacterium]
MRNMFPSWVYRGAWIVLAVFCAFGLFDHSLWSSNDTREGAMISEMVREGVWVTPVFNGRPYLEKPPLLHWTAVVLCRLFGRVNEGLVRLPAALFGFGALWIIGLWARDLLRERAGLVAAFLCATSALYFEYSRIVLTDAALTFMVVLALYLFWRAYSPGQPSYARHSGLREGGNALAEPGATGPRGWKRYLAFMMVAAAAFYAKGFIGPGLVWIPVGAFLVYRREWKLLVSLGAAFSVVFVLALAPWVAALWHAGGQAFLHGVFWENQFGRFLAFNDPNLPLDPYYVHKESVLYYLISLPARLMPWTLLVIPALIYFFRKTCGAFRAESPVEDQPACPSSARAIALAHRNFPPQADPPAEDNVVAGVDDPGPASARPATVISCRRPDSPPAGLPVIFIRFALLGMLVLLHVSSAKAACYTLPLFPILFLLTGIWLEDTAILWKSVLERRLIGLTFGLVGFVVLAVPLGYVLLFAVGANIIRLSASGGATASFALALLALATGGYAALRLSRMFRSGRRNEAILTAPIVLAVVGMLDAAIFLPIVDYDRTYKPLAALVSQELNAGARIALAGERERDLGGLMFYLNSRLKVVALTNAVEWQAFLYERPGRAGVVVAESDLKEAELLLRGKTFKVIQPANCGRKSKEFRLVMNVVDPARPMLRKRAPAR